VIELYHYTTPLHLRSIVSEGVLRPTESNVSLLEEHAGPDVVWATDAPSLPEIGAHGLGPIKGGVRIAFRHPRAVRWMEWPWRERMDPLWRDAMVSAGGGDAAAQHWWLVEGPVPMKLWESLAIDPTGRYLPGSMTLFEGRNRIQRLKQGIIAADA
jgi:hypothetical protein